LDVVFSTSLYTKIGTDHTLLRIKFPFKNEVKRSDKSMYKYKYKYKYGPTHQEAQEMIGVRETSFIRISNQTAGVRLRVNGSYTIGTGDNAQRIELKSPDTDTFSAGTAKTITLPNYAYDIHIEVEENTGICGPFGCIYSRRCFWKNFVLPACFRVRGPLYGGGCEHRPDCPPPVEGNRSSRNPFLPSSRDGSDAQRYY
jgi:hypothetical protein